MYTMSSRCVNTYRRTVNTYTNEGKMVFLYSFIRVFLPPRTISSLCAANAHKTICFCDDKAKNSFLFVQLVYAEQKLWCCMFAIYTHGKIHRRTVKLNFILVCNMSFVWFQRLMLVLDPYRLHVCMRTGWLLDAPHMYVCVLRTCSSERIIKRRSHSPFSLCSFYFIRSNERNDRGKLNN